MRLSDREMRWTTEQGDFSWAAASHSNGKTGNSRVSMSLVPLRNSVQGEVPISRGTSHVFILIYGMREILINSRVTQRSESRVRQRSKAAKRAKSKGWWRRLLDTGNTQSSELFIYTVQSSPVPQGGGTMTVSRAHRGKPRSDRQMTQSGGTVFSPVWPSAG